MFRQSTALLGELRLSPLNVRSSPNPDAVVALAASIASIGLIMPLGVFRTDEQLEVIAGGQRLAALQQLQADGTIPADHPVNVVEVDDPALLTDISLSENAIRVDMTIADEVTAFKTLVDSGATVEQVAFRYAETVVHVERRLALANLYGPIFDLLASGELDLDQAQSFASTQDHDRQKEVFDVLFAPGRHEHEQHAYYIRNRILHSATRGTDPICIFVGREAFEAAGGIVERDLFDDDGADAAAQWSPTSIIDDLAQAKIIVEAERIREEEGLGFVAPFLSSYVPYGGDYRRLDKAEVPEDKSTVGKALLLERNGTLSITAEFYTNLPASPRASSGGENPELTKPKATNEVTVKALRECAEQRRDILRSHLVKPDNRRFAAALGIFSIVDRMIAQYHGMSDSGNSLSAGTPGNVGGFEGYWQTMPASLAVQEEFSALPGKWLKAGAKAEGTSARFKAFLELEDDEQLRWLAYVTARGMEPAHHASQGGLANAVHPFHDDLGLMLGIDLRTEWTPTAENYLAAMTGPQLRALFEQAGPVGQDVGKLKKGELVTLAEKLANPETPIDKETATAQAFLRSWQPGPMKFSAPPKPKRERKAKAETAERKPRRTRKQDAAVVEDAPERQLEDA